MAALRSQVKTRLSEDQLGDYSPYPKQAQFHDAGATFRQRLLRAGNQQGKTTAAGAEGAYHLTGEYPAWWKGRRFDRPIVMWAASDTGETTRDNPQRLLLGSVGSLGVGMIPKRCIGDTGRAVGVTNLFDFVKVKHIAGGWSTLRLKHYSQGRTKWQGPPVDVVWFDEEPDAEIYDEGLARTIATDGIAMMSFTPLRGMSEVVRRFLMNPAADQIDVNMTIEDALHIAPERRAAIIASFAPHERDARARGIPVLGSGRVFPVEQAQIVEAALAEIPEHWPRLCGLDFGWDHPAAMVWAAWDRDTDTVHIYDAVRVREQTPVMHASSIKARGAWIPVAWPHDGLNTEKGSGEELAKLYKVEGVAMLPRQASWPDGGNSVERGLLEMLKRMQTGRLRVAAHLTEWFEEFMLYHRKGGKLMKEGEDLMSATRYLLMMLRHAKVEMAREEELVEVWEPFDRGAGY